MTVVFGVDGLSVVAINKHKKDHRFLYAVLMIKHRDGFLIFWSSFVGKQTTHFLTFTLPYQKTFGTFRCLRANHRSKSYLIRIYSMINFSSPSDSDLLCKMQAGDEEAFVMLYKKRQQAVYRFALQMSGSEIVAEDVTQEVFITLLQEPNRYDESRGSLSAFLYGVARKKILQRLKKESRLLSLFEDEKEDDENFVADADPLRELTRVETIKAVQQAVLALPQHYREVVVLCDLHELSYADAATIIGCAVGTVRSRLHRARGILIEKLKLKEKKEPESENANQKRCYA